MKSEFPEGSSFTSDEIKKKITPIYYTHFRITIKTNICVDILREFFELSEAYTTVNAKRQRAYRIVSHNKNGYEGEPLSRIPATQMVKPFLKFSKR